MEKRLIIQKENRNDYVRHKVSAFECLPIVLVQQRCRCSNVI